MSFKFPSQEVHVDVYHVGARVKVDPPHVVQDAVTCAQFIAMLDQVIDEGMFAGCELDLYIMNEESMRRVIELERAELHHVV